MLFHHFWTWVKRFAFRRTSFSGFLKIILQLTIETIPGKSCFLSAKEFFLSISDFYRINSGLSAKIFCAVMSKLHFAYPSETENLSFFTDFFNELFLETNIKLLALTKSFIGKFDKTAVFVLLGTIWGNLLFWISFFSVSFSENERAKSFNVLPESFLWVSKTAFYMFRGTNWGTILSSMCPMNKLNKIFFSKKNFGFSSFLDWVKTLIVLSIFSTWLWNFLFPPNRWDIIRELLIVFLGKSLFFSIFDLYGRVWGLSAKNFCALMSKLPFKYLLEFEA